MAHFLDSIVSQMGGRTLQVFAMVVFVVELLACLIAALAMLSMDLPQSLLLLIAGPLVILLINAPIYLFGGVKKKEQRIPAPVGHNK